MSRIKIADIAYYLPEAVVTNAQLCAVNPAWDSRSLHERSGVQQRHIADEKETALDLAVAACNKIFAKNKNLIEKIDGIIFCTQSPDYIMPPNACLLHKFLELPEEVFAFDFNLACSGYIYGIALAQGLIVSNVAKDVLLVNADTYSKYIHENDRSARVLFGDGAAVSWLTASQTSQGIIDIVCSTSGLHHDKFMIPAGGCRIPKSEKTRIPRLDSSGNVRSDETIHMDGLGILAFVNSKVPQQIQQILERNALTMDEVDFFIFHQASKVALDTLINSLGIPLEKTYQNLQNMGNTVSASIPMALQDVLEKGLITTGDKVVLSGFGVGLSWGTAILEI